MLTLELVLGLVIILAAIAATIWVWRYGRDYEQEMPKRPPYDSDRRMGDSYAGRQRELARKPINSFPTKRDE